MGRGRSGVRGRASASARDRDPQLVARVEHLDPRVRRDEPRQLVGADRVPREHRDRDAPVSVTARSRWCALMGASGQRTTVTAPADAYQAAICGELVHTTTPHRPSSSCADDACAAATSRTSTCSRRPTPAAAIAAAGSSVWTWTCHVPSPPTTATESPSAAIAACRAASRSASALLTSSITSNAPPAGSTGHGCGRRRGQPRRAVAVRRLARRPPAPARRAPRAGRTPPRRATCAARSTGCSALIPASARCASATTEPSMVARSAPASAAVAALRATSSASVRIVPSWGSCMAPRAARAAAARHRATSTASASRGQPLREPGQVLADDDPGVAARRAHRAAGEHPRDVPDVLAR